MNPVILLERDAELTAPVQPEQLHEVFFQGDARAQCFLIRPMHDGAPADLTGCTATGLFIRPDDTTIAGAGEVDEAASAVRVTLSAPCCALTGRFAFAVRVHASNFQAVIYACTGVIRPAAAGEPVADDSFVTEEDVQQLIARLNTAVRDAENAAEALALDGKADIAGTEQIRFRNLAASVTLEDLRSRVSLGHMRIAGYDAATHTLNTIANSSLTLDRVSLAELPDGMLRNGTAWEDPVTLAHRIITLTDADGLYLWGAPPGTETVYRGVTLHADNTFTIDAARVRAGFPSAAYCYIGRPNEAAALRSVTAEGVLLPAWMTDPSVTARLTALEARAAALEETPLAPELQLPAEAAAVVGREWNLYTKNAVRGALPEAWELSWSVSPAFAGSCIRLNDCLRIVPAAADTGPHTLTLSARHRVTGQTALFRRMTLHVLPDEPPAGRRFLIIGDSLTANGIVAAELQDHLSGGAWTSVGTLTARPVLEDGPHTVCHEGRSGWSAVDYTTLAVRGGIANPFWNAERGAFDFGLYLARAGLSLPDAVLLHLGTNGVSEPEAQTAALRTMADAVHAVDASLPVLVGLIPPGASQDGFGRTAGLSSAAQFDRKAFDLRTQVMAAFQDSEAADVHPRYLALATAHDFPAVTEPASARNPSPVTRQADTVHPSLYGYLHLADSTYAALLRCFAEEAGA